MRTLASLIILAASFTCQRTYAQGEPAIAPNAQPVGPQKPVQQYYVEDGGAHGGVLESIVIPPKVNAPFTLLLQTEWVRIPKAAFTRNGGISSQRMGKWNRK